MPNHFEDRHAGEVYDLNGAPVVLVRQHAANWGHTWIACYMDDYSAARGGRTFAIEPGCMELLGWELLGHIVDGRFISREEAAVHTIREEHGTEIRKALGAMVVAALTLCVACEGRPAVSTTCGVNGGPLTEANGTTAPAWWVVGDSARTVYTSEAAALDASVHVCGRRTRVRQTEND